jgi:hypothetical protein
VVSTNGRIEEVSLEGFFLQGFFVQVQQQEVVVEEEISNSSTFGESYFKGPGNRALGFCCPAVNPERSEGSTKTPPETTRPPCSSPVTRAARRLD